PTSEKGWSGMLPHFVQDSLARWILKADVHCTFKGIAHRSQAHKPDARRYRRNRDQLAIQVAERATACSAVSVNPCFLIWLLSCETLLSLQCCGPNRSLLFFFSNI